MINIIVELSKYLMIALMLVYTFECFAVFNYTDEYTQRSIFRKQNVLMFLLHMIAFLVMYLQTNETKMIGFYGMQVVLFLAVILLYTIIYPRVSRLVVNNMCMLLTVGFVILTRLSLGKAIRQFIIVMISLVIALVIPFFVSRFRFLKEWKWIYAAAGIVALGIVLVLGQTTYGSKLSYTIAGLTFQPSEFVKIIFVFFVASALYKAAGFFEVFTTAVIAAAHVIILVCSKDLGSALIFFVVYVLMVVVASRNWLYLLAGVSGGSVAAYLAYRVFPHIQVRVQAFKDPWSVIDSTGYQITQSLFAITSGGWFGLGLFKGTPESIPFVEADFIFSAIAEELGLLFALCVILICVSSFVMFMNISMNLKDKFYQLTAFGLGVTYIFQVFLTIGGGCKFIPLTGVTLPFISYGGSSVLTTLIMFSITEGLSMIQEEEAEEEKHRRKRIRQKKKKQAGRKKDRPVYEYEDLDFEEDGETFEQEEE